MNRRIFDQINCPIATGLILGLVLLLTASMSYSAELRPMDFKAIRAYDFEKSRQPLAVVEENARIASKEQLLQIEKELDGVLEDAQASYAAKLYTCQILRRISTGESIPALEKCLKDQKLFDIARLALERLASPKVDKIFETELANAEGAYRLGLISSVAQRGDENAVELIERFLKDSDVLLLETSVKALGRIGGEKAVKALESVKADKSLQSTVEDSLLLCADKFAAKSNKDAAEKIYKQLAGKEYPVITRVAAYHGLALVLKEQDAIALLTGLLKNEDKKIREGASKEFIMGFQGKENTESLVKQLPEVSEDTQVLILKAVASRNDSTVLDAVMKISNSQSEKVRIAAIETLGIIGNASIVPHLTEFAGMGGSAGIAAEQALVALHGEDADAALKQQMSSDKAGIRSAAIRVMVQRYTKDILPSLFEYAKDPSLDVRKESIKGVNKLATDKEFASVIGLLVAAKDGEEQRLADLAIRDISKKLKSADERDEIIAKAFPTASDFAKQGLMNLMGDFGGKNSCKAVESELASKDEKMSFMALETLAKWPDASPLATLESIVKKEKEGKLQETAFRGYLHALRLAGNLPEKESIQKFQEALKLSVNRGEKIQVIDVLSKRQELSSLDVLESCLNDAEIGKEVKEAYKSLTALLQSSEISSKSLEVSASHNSDQAKLAIDGRARSRWTSGGSQEPGQWFQVDLGAVMQLEKIILDATGSPTDSPESYKVFVTEDSSQLGNPVSEGKGVSGKLEIALKGAKGRYIRIEQTGKKPGLFWSIHEIKVFKTLDSAKIQHANEVIKSFEAK